MSAKHPAAGAAYPADTQHRARRRALRALAALLMPLPVRAADGPRAAAEGPSLGAPRYAQVVPGHTLRFPADEGSHPDFRTEWWYVTGWLEAQGRAIGFQITFFRTRPDIDTRNPSAFAPHQIIIAHAAISDAQRGRLLHDQHVARAAFGLAGAGLGRTQVWIDDWSLMQDGADYRARIPAREFSLDLILRRTQLPLLQGEAGASRKGPRPEAASYYYSIPHLAVSGTLVESARRHAVTGSAWLDHEWSSSYMDEGATGWDWAGINLDDGGALMVFRMRGAEGQRMWAGGAYRTRSGIRRAFAPEDVGFEPLRTWRSPRTGATYPVAWRIHAAGLDLTLEPLMNDQESDTRATVGTVYWEGAVRAVSAGKPVGQGYLELTGYLQPLRL